MIEPIRLFDELVRVNLGDVTAYRKTRRTACTWMMNYPGQNNRWAAYFEDVPIYDDLHNLNQYSAMETARYLLLHPEEDPIWQTHVAKLVSWAEQTFGRDVPGEPGVQWGANAISEQIVDMYKMGSHTSRYASVNALWYERSGDVQAKEKAFRSFNWATYLCHENGAVTDLAVASQTIWFSDGYGDYIRHFMAGLGSVPEWAPPHQDHLDRSASVLQNVSYRPGDITYSTFDSDAAEVLRLSFSPKHILADGKELARRDGLAAPGWTFDAQGVLRVRHEGSHTVQILGGSAGQGQAR